MAALLALLVAAIGVVGLSTSCSEQEDVTYSFQETMTERRVDDRGGVFERRIVRQHVLPFTAHVQYFDSEGVLEQEQVFLGDEGESYHSVTLAPPTWSRSEKSVRTGPEFLRPSELLEEHLAALNDVEQLGTVELNGQTTLHHRGVRDLQRSFDAALSRGIVLFDGEERQQRLAGREVVDIWSSADDDRLVKMVVRGIFPTVGSQAGYTSEATHEFSRYNEEFDISPPPADQIVEGPP